MSSITCDACLQNGWVLVAKGANVNVCNVLSLAVDEGYGELVHLLLDAGADVNAADGQGQVPLHFAADRGHLAIAEQLIGRGASVHAQALNLVMPLRIAAREGYIQLVELLLREGADTAAESESGKTPLAAAAFEGHMEVVKVLLAHLRGPTALAAAGPVAAAAAAPSVVQAAGLGVYSQQQIVAAAAEAAVAEQWHVWSLLVRVVGQCFPDALQGCWEFLTTDQACRALLGAWRADMAGLEEREAGVTREREELREEGEELRWGLQHFIIQGALLHKQAERSGNEA